MQNGKISMSAEEREDIHSVFNPSPLQLLALVRDEHVYHDVPLLLYDSARKSSVLHK